MNSTDQDPSVADAPELDSVEIKKTSGAIRLVVFAIVVAIGGIAYYQYGDRLSLSNLAEYENQLRSYREQNPVLVYVIAFTVYSLATGASLPGAAALTLFCGWYFGFWRGLLFVSFASSAGATLAFLASRYVLRASLIQKFSSRLEKFDQALETEGAFYLFTLRLIPAVPFFVINAVMGLTQMPTRTFWWVSQIGMLPGTAVFVYAGSQFPNLQTLAEKGPSGILSPGLITAFVALGLFPWVIRKVMSRFRPKVADASSEPVT
ncbi:MAG: TVP38/TMEM64 family protein [Fuerstiella sp.]